MEKFDTFGLEAKGIKTHSGHEGERLRQCNIYFKNKKVAFYSDGDWGGPASIEFYDVNDALKEEAEQAITNLANNMRDPFKGNKALALNEIVSMKEFETDLKKEAKKQPTILLELTDKHGFRMQAYHVTTDHILEPDEVIKLLPGQYEQSGGYKVYRLNEQKKIERYSYGTTY